MRHRDVDQLKKHEELIATLKKELTMYDKIESLNKKIEAKEAELRALWAELADACRETGATAKSVEVYINSLFGLSDTLVTKQTDNVLAVHTFAHRDIMIALGRVQEATHTCGYFQQGWDGIHGLSFCKDGESTWDEVLAALKAKEDYIRAAMRGE